jgi:hypothetical protein
MVEEQMPRNSRILQAVAGVLLFGLAAPCAAFWGLFDIGLWIYVGLGLSLAAYAAHAFALSGVPFTGYRRAARWSTVLLGATFGLWVRPAVAASEAFQSWIGDGPVTAGLKGDTIRAILMLSDWPIGTGVLMAVPIFIATRSRLVTTCVVGASVICGLLAHRTLGATCIPWNLSVSIALYAWACTRRPSSNTCAKCGYSLVGLPTPKCPECGSLLSQ